MAFKNKFLDNVAILGLFFAIIAIMYTVFKDVLVASSIPYSSQIAFIGGVVLALLCFYVIKSMSKENSEEGTIFKYSRFRKHINSMCYGQSLNEDVWELLFVVILAVVIAFIIFFSVMTWVVWTYLTGEEKLSLTLGFGGIVLGLFSILVYFYDKLRTIKDKHTSVREFTELCKKISNLERAVNNLKKMR